MDNIGRTVDLLVTAALVIGTIVLAARVWVLDQRVARLESQMSWGRYAQREIDRVARRGTPLS